jgi:hypothetical protein
VKSKVIVILLLLTTCLNNYDITNNPDCWKSVRETCNEDNRINSGNIRDGNIGVTGN